MKKTLANIWIFIDANRLLTIGIVIACLVLIMLFTIRRKPRMMPNRVLVDTVYTAPTTDEIRMQHELDSVNKLNH